MSTVNSTRVQAIAKSYEAKEGAQAASQRAGSRNGVKFVPVARADASVAQMMPPQEQASDLSTQSVSTANRRPSVEAAPLRKTSAELFRNAHTQGLDIARVRQGARAALGGGKSWANWSKSASARDKLMASRLALAGLDDERSDDELTAVFTPVREQQSDPRDPHTRDDILKLLRQMATQPDSMKDDGKEAFEHFLNDILAGLDTTFMDEVERRKLIGDLKDAAGKDDETLMRSLRKLQGLPELHNEGGKERRAALRQEILDRIGNQVHDGREGTVASASFNAAPAAAGLNDPATFLSVFTQLATQEHSFTSASKLIVGSFTLDALTRGGVINRFMQAVAEELKAATSLRNWRWGYEAATDMGHLKVLSTLIERAEMLAVHMGRMQHVAPR